MLLEGTYVTNIKGKIVKKKNTREALKILTLEHRVCIGMASLTDAQNL